MITAIQRIIIARDNKERDVRLIIRKAPVSKQTFGIDLIQRKGPIRNPSGPRIPGPLLIAKKEIMKIISRMSPTVLPVDVAMIDLLVHAR